MKTKSFLRRSHALASSLFALLFVYIARGLSLYANGTAGSAKYSSQPVNGVTLTNYGLWVASTPANTEALGLTYQQKYLDLGVFNKRIGPMWNDNGSFISRCLSIHST